MHQSPLYIHSYCRMNDTSVILNGKPVFKNETLFTPGEQLRELYKHLAIDYPKFHKMDNLCKSAFLAAELIASQQPLWQTDTALLFSNRSSSFVSDEKHASVINTQNHGPASPATFVYTLPNILMGEISIRHQILSEQVFFIFNKFTPQFMVPYAEALIHQQRAVQVLCGWAEVAGPVCDVFLYLLGTSGKWPHQLQNVEKLYNEMYE